MKKNGAESKEQVHRKNGEQARLARSLPELRRAASGDYILHWTLATWFTVGCVLTVLADLVGRGTIPLPPNWRPAFVEQVIMWLGASLWTGTVIVFLLDIQVRNQKRRIRHYVAEAERQFGAAPAPKTSTEQIADRLDALLGRLDEVESLRQEIEALKAEFAAMQHSQPS